MKLALNGYRCLTAIRRNGNFIHESRIELCDSLAVE
jgi:hypothetical protein